MVSHHVVDEVLERAVDVVDLATCVNTGSP